MSTVNEPSELSIKVDVPEWLGNDGGSSVRLDIQFRSEQRYLRPRQLLDQCSGRSSFDILPIRIVCAGRGTAIESGLLTGGRNFIQKVSLPVSHCCLQFSCFYIIYPYGTCPWNSNKGACVERPRSDIKLYTVQYSLTFGVVRKPVRIPKWTQFSISE